MPGRMMDTKVDLCDPRACRQMYPSDSAIQTIAIPMDGALQHAGLLHLACSLVRLD
jgi:hypothetical protein